MTPEKHCSGNPAINTNMIYTMSTVDCTLQRSAVRHKRNRLHKQTHDALALQSMTFYAEVLAKVSASALRPNSGKVFA